MELKDLACGSVAELGDLTMREGPPLTKGDYQYKLAMVVTFGSLEDFRKALSDGAVRIQQFASSDLPR